MQIASAMLHLERERHNTPLITFGLIFQVCTGVAKSGPQVPNLFVPAFAPTPGLACKILTTWGPTLLAIPVGRRSCCAIRIVRVQLALDVGWPVAACGGDGATAGILSDVCNKRPDRAAAPNPISMSSSNKKKVLASLTQAVVAKLSWLFFGHLASSRSVMRRARGPTAAWKEGIVRAD